MATITIVFRGLMVFNFLKDYMEIGFLNALPTPGQPIGHDEDADPDEPHADGHGDHHPIHVPRILTMTDGVISSILDLRTRENELNKVRNWEIKVNNPLQPTATKFEDPNVEEFKREADPPPDPRDFRWITDLEAEDLHGRDIGSEIDTRKLLLVLYVRHGHFYTRLKSPVLRKIKVNEGDAESFGCVAAVTGCDITYEPTPVKPGEPKVDDVTLVAGGKGGPVIFPFKERDGKDGSTTIYEISNSPPDVPAEGPTPIGEGGHFHMYYDNLFISEPDDRFDLERDDVAPSPDPALCGAAGTGKRDDPL